MLPKQFRNFATWAVFFTWGSNQRTLTRNWLNYGIPLDPKVFQLLDDLIKFGVDALECIPEEDRNQLINWGIKCRFMGATSLYDTFWHHDRQMMQEITEVWRLRLHEVDQYTKPVYENWCRTNPPAYPRGSDVKLMEFQWLPTEWM